MELLGDVGHVEYRFFPFGDSVGVSLATWVMWNLTSFRLETVFVSVQDRCMVYARCTTVLQIVLDAPDGTPRCRESCGISLLSVWRQVSVR